MIVLYTRKGVSRLRAPWGQVRQAAKSRASVVYRVVLDVPMLTVNLEGTRPGLQGGRPRLRTTTPGGTLGASREPRAPRPEGLAQTHRSPEIGSPGGPAGGGWWWTEPSACPLLSYPIGFSHVCHERLDRCYQRLVEPPVHHLVAWPVHPTGDGGIPSVHSECGRVSSTGQ